jgi:hypothetical protein
MDGNPSPSRHDKEDIFTDSIISLPFTDYTRTLLSEVEHRVINKVKDDRSSINQPQSMCYNYDHPHKETAVQAYKSTFKRYK